MYKTGLTIGKFMPPHRGHELLLKTAYANCHELIVQISDGGDHDFIDVARREKIIQEIVDARIVRIKDDRYYNVQLDEHGTVVDESYWKWYIQQTLADLDGVKIDAVFTSDRYGERIAKELNADWVPVDPDREMINISATKIRQNHIRYWDYLAQPAKVELVKTIALVGPESTGKSTLAKWLAGRYSTSYANEFGRTIFEARNGNLSETDYETIVNTQAALIASARENSSHGVCFTDTEALVTNTFSRFYLGTDNKWATFAFANQKIDLYVLLAPDVPLVDDGWRETKQNDRVQFFDYMEKKLREYGKPFVIVKGKNFEERQMSALAEVQKIVWDGWVS